MSESDNEHSGEPIPTIDELISFVRACEDQIGTEGYATPRFRAVLAILEAEAERRTRSPHNTDGPDRGCRAV